MKRLGIAIVLGVALGIAARLADGVAPRWVGNIGAVWFLAAFAAGRLERKIRLGAVLGVAALAAAWAAYYSMRLFVDGTISMRYLGRVGILWLPASVVVGALGGGAGAASRWLKIPWGIALGVLLGEALAVAMLAQRWEQVMVEFLGALAVLIWSKRRASELVGVTLATTLVVALAAGVYRTVLS